MISQRPLLRYKSGFTLIELVVVMGIFTIIMVISASAFKSILTGASRETKLAESQVADIIGLELLRIDLEQAGYGVPTAYQQSITYSEAASETGFPVAGKDPAGMNIPLATAGTSTPPRPLAGGTNNSYYNGSDYLVIRSSVVARNNAAQKWTYVITGSSPVASDDPNENLLPGEGRIVLKPTFSSTPLNQLVMQSNTAFYGYSTSSASLNNISRFYPYIPNEKVIIYGLTDAGVTPRMPFNRADYYIRRPSSDSDVPQRCAPNTGILFKGIVNNTTGTGAGEITEIPLMDCVADFQVIFGLDASVDYDGSVSSYVDIDGLGGYTDVVELRRRVKEAWIFVLTHEGGPDTNFVYPNNKIWVGESIWGTNRGKEFNLQTAIGGSGLTKWDHYRWKVHKLAVKPKNLF